MVSYAAFLKIRMRRIRCRCRILLTTAMQHRYTVTVTITSASARDTVEVQSPAAKLCCTAALKSSFHSSFSDMKTAAVLEGRRNRTLSRSKARYYPRFCRPGRCEAHRPMSRSIASLVLYATANQRTRRGSPVLDSRGSPIYPRFLSGFSPSRLLPDIPAMRALLSRSCSHMRSPYISQDLAGRPFGMDAA